MTKSRDTPHRTPLHSDHQRLGASFTDFAGWSMPVWYSSGIAEHTAVRTTAGLFDLSHMGEIELSGPESGPALDHSLVGHPSRIGVGRARYSMLCDEDGGILDDLVVYRLTEQRFLVVVNAGNVGVVLEALRQRVAGFDTELRDASGEWSLIAVQGPASAAIVSELTDVELAELKYYAIVATSLAGNDVLLARTGCTGEDGFEVYCCPADASYIWNTLTRVGEPHGLVPAGLACRDTLRLEAGMPLYGHELNRDTTPFEAGPAGSLRLARSLASSETRLLPDGGPRARSGCWPGWCRPAGVHPAADTQCWILRLALSSGA